MRLASSDNMPVPRRRALPTQARYRLVGILVAALTLWAVPTAVAGAHAVPVVHLPASTKPEGPAISPRSGRPITLALPYKHAVNPTTHEVQVPAGTTIPTTLYSTVAGQDGNTYDFSIVGGNFTSGAGVTTVPLDILPVVITFTPTGDVYDPTTANSSCGEPVSPLTAVETGPELVPRKWYAGHTYLGHGQYLDAQLRGEFWNWTNPSGASPGFGLNLSVSNPENLTYSIDAPEENAGTCDNLGEIDLNTFDAAVQSFLQSWTSTTVPLFVLKNVVLTESNGTICCVGGYHSAFTDSSGNTQTYAVTSYLTPDVVASSGLGVFDNLAIISHEIAEWVNDPFVNDPTPSWGHLGQVSGCQANLEVGDPLTGTLFSVAPPRPGGLTYDLQELVYAGWFYDQNWGVNGWYSTRGTFTSGASLCS